MKKFTKAVALLLAVILAVAAFTGCNKEKEPVGEEFVYVPTYTEFPFDIRYVRNAVISGDTLYLSADIVDGMRTETYVDENGEEQTSEYENWVSKLFTVKLDGSDAKEIPNYSPSGSDDDSDGTKWSDVRDIKVSEDGKITVVKQIGESVFDLPENFDPEKDEKWNYYSHDVVTVIAEVIDIEGNILETKEIFRDETGSDYPYSFSQSKNGNWYVGSNTGFSVLDNTGKLLYKIPSEGNDYGYRDIVELKDGRVGLVGWNYSNEKGGMEIRILDDATQSLGESIPLPENSSNIVGSSEKYDIIYETGNGLWGYVVETQEKEKIINWLDADINPDSITVRKILDNGNVFCVLSEWGKDDEGYETSLVTIEKKDASEYPERKVLTLALMYTDYELRNMVLDFNKKNTEYRIKVVDYSEFNTEEDLNAGMTQLNTEIISGNVPDIICSQNIDVSRYAAKGILEDLTPYIESGIGMEGLVQPFFNALKDSEGKLYEIYPNFSLGTVVGLSSVVGDGSSWNFDDVYAAMEKLQEGATIFPEYFTKENALATCVTRNIGEFVNWETGECRFDSEEFIALLEFANSFVLELPEDFYEGRKWESDSARMLTGKQLLMPVEMYSFDDFRGQTFYSLGKDISFVGYPTLSGGGSSFTILGAGLAMSSTSEYKDVAWEFMSQLLSREYQENNMYGWGIPTNKELFDKLAEDSKTPTFSEHADEYLFKGEVAATAAGDVAAAAEEPVVPEEEEKSDVPEVKFREPQINEQGWYEEPKSWVWNNDTDIPVYAMTDMEYDAIMNVINSTTAVQRYDQSIMGIINEEVQAYFQGQKSVEETAKMIQSKVKLYVSEQK